MQKKIVLKIRTIVMHLLGGNKIKTKTARYLNKKEESHDIDSGHEQVLDKTQSCHWTKAYFVSGDSRVLNQSLWGSRIFSIWETNFEEFFSPPQKKLFGICS